MSELKKIEGVEIFSVGTWNGKKITEKDLENIVACYARTKEFITPSIKIGHDNEQAFLQKEGLPAAGWVENVRKVGSKLVADFVDIPKKIYELIAKKAYRKVSCELYNDVEMDGETYPKLLGAVALLGADMPAVMNLSDILSNYKFSAIESFAMDLKTDTIMNSNPKNKSEDNPMPDQVADLQSNLSASLKENAELKAKIDTFSKSHNELTDQVKSLIESNKTLAAARDKALGEVEATRVDAFVSGLVADKLCAPAMKDLVKSLFSNQAEKYAVGDKQLTREEIVKSILTQAKTLSKTNFTSNTTTDKPEKKETDNQQAHAKKIEEYAFKHKCSYKEAYRAVMRDVDQTPPAINSDPGDENDNDDSDDE